MAWKQWTDPEMDEGKISEFNAAAFKMRRLDKNLDSLNEISTNLFAWNEEFGVFNFELKLARCNQLYQEVESKLNPNDRKDGLKLKQAIEKILQKYPIFIKPRGNKQKMKINKDMQIIMANWLIKYETLVRKFIDEHGMDTRYDDEEGL